MTDLRSLCADLQAEHEALDAIVAALDEVDWKLPTPADNWDVRDTVAHLCYFDETARLAVVDPSAFAAHVDDLVNGWLGRPDERLGRSTPPDELLARWRSSRAALVDAVAVLDPAARLPWYGPPMSTVSFVTARLMETWAHGQDVRDAVEAPPLVSDRLRHVCHIGVAARAYAYLVNGIDNPEAPIRVEATAPDGSLWAWGPDEAVDRVRGTALDLALVVTQRRHVADTDLAVEGPVAEQWISIAQSFAGPAGTGRPPGLRRLTN